MTLRKNCRNHGVHAIACRGVLNHRLQASLIRTTLLTHRIRLSFPTSVVWNAQCACLPTLSSPNRAGERNGRLQRGSLPPQVWWWTKANVKHRQVLGSDVLVEPQSVFFSAKCPMHVWCSEELYPLHIHGHKRMPDLCLA